MRSMARAAKVLRAVAEGKTLAESGESIGVTGSRARQLLSKICRELNLPSDISEIRHRKKECLQRLGVFENDPLTQLNPKIAYNLTRALALNETDDLTPSYLSNISASQLLNSSLTLVVVSEAQEWLVRNGTSLKRRPPESKTEMQAVQRAIATLDAFQFDTATVRLQLQFLENGAE